VGYHATREAHEGSIGGMATAFGGTLVEKATAMYVQRLVSALVSSAFNTGSFYGLKVTDARDLTTQLQKRGPRTAVYGSESKVQRTPPPSRRAARARCPTG